MIFQKDIVNNGRQSELDLSRGFAAILLVICHIGLYLGNKSDKIMYTFADIIGSEPVAPVFMALLGIGIAFSKRSNSHYLFSRGIRIFIAGYALSAFRTLLPRIFFGNIDAWTTLGSFFAVDIFQFAGLSFMFMALLKKFRMPSWAVLVLSVLMVLLGQFFIVNPLPVENDTLICFINLFIPITEWSCFPFLTWFFFPAFGLVFGEILQHCANKKLFYALLLPLSLVGIIYVYSLFYSYYPDYAQKYYFGGNYYYMGIKNVFLTIAFITFSFSFWYFAQQFMPKFIKSFLTFLSRNLSVFYIFTWIFICIAMHISAKFSITHNTVMLIGEMIITVFLSCVCVCLYHTFKSRCKATKNHLMKTE